MFNLLHLAVSCSDGDTVEKILEPESFKAYTFWFSYVYMRDASITLMEDEKGEALKKDIESKKELLADLIRKNPPTRARERMAMASIFERLGLKK